MFTKLVTIDRTARTILLPFALLASASASACSSHGRADASNQQAPTAAAGADASSDASTDPAPLAPPNPKSGFQMAMDFEAPAYSESWKCLISTVPQIDGAIWPVHHVASSQTPRVHHMDVSALALTPLGLPDGMYDCKGIYDQHPELMENGVIIYASQAAVQDLTLPDGIVASVPGGIQIMQELHYVNATATPARVWSTVNAYRLESGSPRDSIWGSAVRDRHIEVPAHGESDEWTECVMSDDIDLIILSSHTHQFATKTTVAHFDGQTAGEPFYENTDWHAPRLIQYDPPMHIKKGEGFRFNCHFKNPTDKTVEWGFTSADEMCQIAIVHTPSSASITCKQVASSDGVLN